MGRMNNNPTLIQITAWCRPVDKPLSEPMMVRLPTHIYVSLGVSELKHYSIDTSFCSLYLMNEYCFFFSFLSLFCFRLFVGMFVFYLIGFHMFRLK